MYVTRSSVWFALFPVVTLVMLTTAGVGAYEVLLEVSLARE